MNGKENRLFFSYVIPSVLAFTLSGVYAVVDGFFVGNSIGDGGLSAMNMAYPVAAFIQAVGAGIGMGASVHFTISSAAGEKGRARRFAAGGLWLLLAVGLFMSAALWMSAAEILRLFGARGTLLTLGFEYLEVIALGSILQIAGTGLVPLIRNHGGSFCAAAVMVSGFAVNIILDYLFIWIYGWGMAGAAWATVIGQGLAAAGGALYLMAKKQFILSMPLKAITGVAKGIVEVGLAPFGMAMTPIFSLILINRFTVAYGGAEAVAAYACISYVICIVYLALQGAGEGSQPLMSRYYGAGLPAALRHTKWLAYGTGLFLAAVSFGLFLWLRWDVGALLGASNQVSQLVAEVFPVFLAALPFIAVNRTATASFYATGRIREAHALTWAEPVFLAMLLCILPPLGGQPMVWWSITLARMAAACLILFLGKRNRGQLEPCSEAAAG